MDFDSPATFAQIPTCAPPERRGAQVGIWAKVAKKSKNNDTRHKKDKPKKRRKFLAEQGGFENGDVRLYIRYANEPFSKQRSYAGN